MLLSASNSIPITSIDNVSYFSLNDFIDVLELKSDFIIDNNKAILYYKNHRIVLSGGSSYILINNDIYHLYHHVLYTKDDFYIPVFSFIEHIKKNQIINNLTIDSMGHSIVMAMPRYNILNYALSTKGNGYSIDINTSKTFDENLLAYSRSGNNWLSITIPGGTIDSININKSQIIHPIIDVKTTQMKGAAQISFLLKIIPDDITMSSKNKTINLGLFVSQQTTAQKIKQDKEKNIINTIVLDAGHGGKDPGACIKNCKIKEKDITLAITKKLGHILERKYNMNVIYTREDDRFIKLHHRTQIANDNDAKIFISIHANSIENSPRTKGFETYLLKIEKSSAAINEVEKRENNVLKLEADNNTNTISRMNAILIQSANFEQSEDLAQLIQQEISKTTHKNLNRGVKQAGFQVLWGATMPNVLIEVGFITNSDEAKNLTSSKYQDKIANGIANAIMLYKKKHEKHIFE